MSKLRWAKLWWSDWENDPALRLCSLAAQGLWMRLLCLAAQSRTYGEVLVAGKPPTIGEIAHIVGDHHVRIRALINELERHKVLARTEQGAIMSRRMVADIKEHLRKRNAGLNGGNPALTSGHDPGPNGGLLKQPLKHNSDGLLKVEEEEEVNHHIHKNNKAPRTPPHGGARTRDEKIGGRKKEKEPKCGFVGAVQGIIDERQGHSAEVVPLPVKRAAANQ